MVTEACRAGKKVILLVMVLVSFTPIIVSSSTQPNNQPQVAIWVDRWCGSTYSNGDPIIVYFVVEASWIPCSDSGSSPVNLGSFVRDYSMPASVPTPSPTPSPGDCSTAMVSIIDHYPNYAGSCYLFQNQVVTVNTPYYFTGTVECGLGGEGFEWLEIVATVGTVTVGNNCLFYLDCEKEVSGSTGTPPPTQSPPVSYVSPCHDTDADGYTNCEGDCNDYDPAVYPGAKDMCDEINNDCDGDTDEDCPESTITLSISPEYVNVEESVFISGALSPPRTTDIHLIFTKPDNTMFTSVVISKEDGAFSFLFDPDSSGLWSIQASVKESRDYRATTSDKIFFTVKKAKTSLFLKTDSTLLYPSEEIKISGILSPAMAANIVLTIKDEKGHQQEKIVTSLSDGTFFSSYRPDSVGIWSVSAKFEGSQKYENSDSNTVFFTVTKEESAISLNISSKYEKVTEGNSIEIKGQIRPPRSTTVSLYLESGDGKFTYQVLSMEDGTFSYFFVPEFAGKWFIYAQIPEETAYKSAKSEIFSFLVESAIPDLAISNLIIDPASAEPDEKVRIYFEVENLGTGTAEGITVHVVANSKAGKKIIHERKIGKISAGKWTSIELNWVATFGVEAFTIEVDPSNHITEVSEENNYMTQEINIRYKRDLSILNVFLSSEGIRQNDKILITAQVQCEGEVPSNFQIEFWIGIPGEGLRIKTVTLNDPLPENFVEANWTAQSGEHQVYVVVDPLKKVNEFDETNNIFRKDITVRGTSLPLVGTTAIVIMTSSAGVYWYVKNTGRSTLRRGSRVSRKFRESGRSLRDPSKIMKGTEPAQKLKPGILYRAGEALIRAGETTAATEIGAKLYKALYSKRYHKDEAQMRSFEEMVQHKQEILDRVITHLVVFEGYIDTEEFCRFFNVDESELQEILRFLCWKGYIEEVNS